MSKYFRYGVIEDIKTVRRIPVGRFWGVRVLITSYVWLGPFVFFGLHFVFNWLNPQVALPARLYQAVLFTVAVQVAMFLHAFGHILSGKLVGSAMDELLIASTRDVNLYHGDQSQVPGRVHLGRALGGPVLNLVAAGVLFALPVPPGWGADLVTSVVTVNLFFGLGSFLPIRSVDGEVIWREVLRGRQDYLEKRAKRASEAKFDAAMAKVADVEPPDYDRL